MSRSRRSRPRPAVAPSTVAALPGSTADPEAPAGDPARIARFGLLAYGLVAVAHLAAGWAPDSRTWGVHALAFLPRPVWFAALALWAVLLAPRPAARLGAAALAAAGRVLGSRWGTALVALVAAVLFALLRLRFQFLGDGVVWFKKIELREGFHYFEPLAAAVVSWVARLDTEFERGAAWPSIAAGLAWVLGTAALCRAAWREPMARALGWCLLVLHPLVLLFFGYVESYPGLIVLQIFFVWALLGGGRAGPALATAILAVAIAWHLQALAWLPALVAWPFVRRREQGGRRSAGRDLAAGAAAGALAVAVAFLLVRATGNSPRRLLGLLWGETGLGGAAASNLFSMRHLVDVANEIALLCGPIFVLGAVAVAAGRRTRIPADGRWGLVMLLLASAICFVLLVNPHIGGARDWDLYLGLVVPATLLAVEAWRRLGPTGRAGEAHSHLAPSLAGWALGLAFVTTAAYVAVQLDTPRAARRMEVLIDPRGPFGNYARGYALETLGIYYRDHDIAAARGAYARAVQANPANPRYYNNLANAELRLGNVEAARDAFRRAADLGMREWFVLHNIGVAEMQLGHPEAAEPVFAELVQRWPDRWLARAALGRARLGLGRPAEALPEIERARALAPSEPEVHYYLGLALRDLGRREEARAAFAAALQLDPAHAAAQRELQAFETDRR